MLNLAVRGCNLILELPRLVTGKKSIKKKKKLKFELREVKNRKYIDKKSFNIRFQDFPEDIFLSITFCILVKSQCVSTPVVQYLVIQAEYDFHKKMFVGKKKSFHSNYASYLALRKKNYTTGRLEHSVSARYVNKKKDTVKQKVVMYLIQLYTQLFGCGLQIKKKFRDIIIVTH